MLRLGTVGTSWITQSFIEGAVTSEKIKICACYSRNADKAKAFAEKNNAEFAFDDIREMAESDCIDAVYIASPNSLHHSQSKLFLSNNKNVLVEKPATTTADEYKELANLAKSNGLIYSEAIMSVHTPEFEILKNQISEIGKIRTANLVFCQLSSKYNLYVEGKNPNIFNPEFHTGCLMDIGVYNVYLSAALFGKPNRIISKSDFLESGADSSGTAILDYGDFTVNLIYSKVGQNYSPSEIIGDGGTVSIDSISQITGLDRINRSEKINIVKYDIPRNIVMSHEAKYFAEQIESGNRYSADYVKFEQLAILVREICDEIRQQNGFLF